VVLMKSMLEYDPDKRISASEALKNAWIDRPEKDRISFADAKISLKKLKNFKTQMVLQRAVLTYFATVQLMPQEQKQLQEVFASFDIDHDGKLTEEDLLKCYQKIYGSTGRAKIEADLIMKHLDLKRKGYINFTGLIISK